MLFSNVREDEFEYVKEFEKNYVVYKEVKLKNRGCRCSNCGTFHTNVKEYILFMHTRNVWLSLNTEGLYALNAELHIWRIIHFVAK